MTHSFQINCSRPYQVIWTRLIRSGAQEFGLHVDIEEEFGLLFGTLFITVSGDEASITSFCDTLADFLDDWSSKHGRNKAK